MRLQLIKCLYKICQWLTHDHKNNLYILEEVGNLDGSDILLRFDKKAWMDICKRRIIPALKE